MATTEAEAETTAAAGWWDVLVSLFVPCKPIFFPDCAHISSSSSSSSFSSSPSERRRRRSSSSTSTVIGTILCDKMKSKLKLCFQQQQQQQQQNEGGPVPFLILELPIASSDLHGSCRVLLECDRASSGGGPLLGSPTWTVYFNGRKVGFARRREVLAEDGAIGWALESVRAVSGGMGILPPSPTRTTKSKDLGSGSGGGGGRIFEYFRGRFERVVGSADSQSYHLVDPHGCLGPELSFFFLRL